MNIAYACLPEIGLIITVWGSKVTLAEWTANVEKQIADPEVALTDRALVDLSGASIGNSFGERELMKVIDFVAESNFNLVGRKMALLGGNEFARARLFEKLASTKRINVIVFNDLERACIWLGIDPERARSEIKILRSKMSSNT